MAKVALIGAGGFVFPLRLLGDFLGFPALQSSTFSLMDVDLGRARRTARYAQEIAEHYGLPATFEVTDDRRAALDGADYVVITFQVGGLEAFAHDVNIPRK